MSDGDKRVGPRCATGEVEGTGSDISLVCGFRPAAVMVHNVDGEVLLFWNRSLPNAYGYKNLGVSSGTNANESAHTHAVALDSGVSGATAPSVSVVQEAPSQAFTKPVIALTHNADPVANLAAAALYAYEGQGSGSINQIFLESTTNSNASVLGETADGVAGSAASARFWVQDNDTPNGVQIYVNEASSDQLEFVSPTEADGYIIMPFEAAGIPGAAVKVTVHHNASAADGKALYFDDNGAADAQLAFVDTGAAGGVIPEADIEVLLPAYVDTGIIATAASHTHGPGNLADAASGAGSAHTHVFSGAAGENALITSLGITPNVRGFTIGADTDVNVAAETIYWTAWRY